MVQAVYHNYYHVTSCHVCVCAYNYNRNITQTKYKENKSVTYYLIQPLPNHFQKYLSTVNSPVLLYLRKLLIDYRVVIIQKVKSNNEIIMLGCVCISALL